MGTVGETAKLFSVSDQTIRTWSSEFREYLSPSAEPGGGKPRYFTEEDLRVFAQIAAMRERNAGYEQIHQALDAGDRAVPPRPAEEEAAEGETSRTMVTRLTATVARFEGELEAVRDERDYLRRQMDEERQARLEAEKRATAAETELRVLRERSQAQQPVEDEAGIAPGGSSEGEQRATGRPWWRFWGA